eukprot:1072473-Prorocentrum_minimum.AAC.1
MGVHARDGCDTRGLLWRRHALLQVVPPVPCADAHLLGDAQRDVHAHDDGARPVLQRGQRRALPPLQNAPSRAPPQPRQADHQQVSPLIAPF